VSAVTTNTAVPEFSAWNTGVVTMVCLFVVFVALRRKTRSKKQTEVYRYF